MAYLVLARKYRPQSFDDVVRQSHVTQTLANAIAAGRVAHAILFAGPRGTGKTTIARIMAKSMNCAEGPTATPCNTCRSCREITAGSSADVFEIDGASNNGVDHIRELRSNLKYLPSRSSYKIYIIDEVHMLSTPAFNALLKTLEEPPPHVLFFFATTEPHKIPVTILSRCQRHDLKRIDTAAIGRHLARLCEREAIAADAASLELIARAAGGSMRDALSLLDQVIGSSDGALSREHTLYVLGVLDQEALFDLVQALIDRDLGRSLQILDDLYRHGHNLKEFYYALMQHLRDLLVIKGGQNVSELVDAPAHDLERLGRQAAPVAAEDLQQLFDLLLHEEGTVRQSARPRLALEMLLLRLLRQPPALPIDELIEKLDRLAGALRAAPAVVPAPALQPAAPAVSRSDETPPAECPAPEMPAGPAGEQWQRLLAHLQARNPGLAASLGCARAVEWNDARLVIEVNGKAFQLNMIRREKNLALLRQVCGEICGRAVQVVIEGGENTRSTGRSDRRGDIKRRQQEALSDPLVADAVDLFDGKVVDVKVLAADAPRAPQTEG